MHKAQREALDGHLRGCAACRAELQSLRQTVALLHTLAETPADPPESVRSALAQKIRAIRQPMNWRERLRLQWRVGGLAAQARTWGYGLAVSVLLFTGGAVTLERWHTPGETLNVGLGWEQHHPGQAPQNIVPPQQPTAAPDANAAGMPARGARIRAWVENAVTVGQQTTIYLFIAPGSSLADASLSLYPSASMTVGGKATLQNDASYLLYRGSIIVGNEETQWIPVSLLPGSAGKHLVRVVLHENGRILAQETVPLMVNP